jgi:hypothetical protein
MRTGGLGQIDATRGDVIEVALMPLLVCLSVGDGGEDEQDEDVAQPRGCLGASRQ